MGRDLNRLWGIRMWTRFEGGPVLHSAYPFKAAEVSTPLLFQPGLNVLYGRNGAGKSRLLGNLRSALTGLRGPNQVELYVRVPEEADGDFPVLPMPSMSDYHYWDWDDVLAAASLNTRMRLGRNGPDEELLRALVKSPCLALIPVGEDRPRWEVWLALDPSRPDLRPWVDEADNLMRSYADALAAYGTVEDDDEGAEEIWQRLNGATSDIAWHPFFSILSTLPDGSADNALDEICEQWSRGVGPLRDGLPLPIAKVVEVDSLRWPRFLCEVEDGTLDVLLRENALPFLYEGGDNSEQRALFLSQRVSRTFRRFLAEAPEIVAADHPRGFGEFSGETASWYLKGENGFLRPLRDASAAEARWARFAAMLATADRNRAIASYQNAPEGYRFRPVGGHGDAVVDEDAPRVLLIDEPELHLHRSAESQMADSLKQLTENEIDYLFVATHTPDLLNVPGANLYWIEGGHTRRFTGAGLSQLEGLGLKPSDLLGITRVILLVEGHHDHLVLRHTIGDQLRQSGTYLLPLDGGQLLEGSVESEILFDFTTAHVVALLDNLDPLVAKDAYQQAVSIRIEKGVREAVDHVDRVLPKRTSSEFLYLNKWIKRAIAREGEFPYSRFTPTGLPLPDIIEYLPVTSFVPKAQSWEQLRQRHQELVESGAVKNDRLRRNFKAWVAATYNTDFDDDRIIAAVDALEEIPEDFLRLAAECELVGQLDKGEASL